MTWVNPYQRTPEWYRARLGMTTASRVSRVVNGTVRGWATLAAELAYEVSPEYVHQEIEVPSIANGKIYEPTAIANAEIDLGEDFEPIGFVVHPQYEWLGCSSDFMARGYSVNGEVKCPLLLEEHMQVQQNRRMPVKHYPQVQCQMACHDVLTTLFISYYSGNKKIPTSMRTAYVEVRRDDRYIEQMYARCEDFNRYRNGEELITKASSSMEVAAKLF